MADNPTITMSDDVVQPDDAKEATPDIFLYNGQDDIPENSIHVQVDGALKVICAQAFFVHSHLQQVDLPKSLTTIGSRAFFMCEALRRINFPSTVETIETCAFVGCTQLVEAKLPMGLQVLGSAAFSKCESLTHFQVPPLVQVLDVNLFANCKNLYSVELAPTGITRIGSRAFQNCHQLRNIVLPESIDEVGNWAFAGCTCLREALGISATINEDQSRLIFQALQSRFAQYPLHELCYYQGYYYESCLLVSDMATAKDDSSNDALPTFLVEAAQELQHHLQQGNLSKLYEPEEHSNMTPLHVLALSSRPNLILAEALVQYWRQTTNQGQRQDTTTMQKQEEGSNISCPAQIRDEWNRDPLMYASMNLTTESTRLTKLLLEMVLKPRLTSLGLKAWHLDVSQSMNCLLYQSKTRSERIQHLEQVLVKLDRFVQMERLSLLELAIWKRSIKGVIMDNVGKGRNDTNYNSNGDNARTRDRTKCRTLCGAQIILSHVILFLGDP